MSKRKFVVSLEFEADPRDLARPSTDKPLLDAQLVATSILSAALDKMQASSSEIRVVVAARDDLETAQ